jgi:hypothetical protein
MKLTCLALASILSFSTFANTSDYMIMDENIELVQEGERLELPKVKIRDVKNLIERMGTDNTCMDEYLQRRRQLITKLALSPVTIVGGTYASLFVGAFAGLGVAIIANATTYPDPLIYVANGIIGAGIAAGATTLTDTSLAAFQLADIDTILKSLAEQHLNQPGKKSQKLYERYLNNSDRASEEEFFAKLLSFDANGQLCDGTLTKKNSSRLKKRLARTKHLRKAI